MEPKNHKIEKEHHLPSTSIVGFQPLIFQGSSCQLQCFQHLQEKPKLVVQKASVRATKQSSPNKTTKKGGFGRGHPGPEVKDTVTVIVTVIVILDSPLKAPWNNAFAGSKCVPESDSESSSDSRTSRRHKNDSSTGGSWFLATGAAALPRVHLPLWHLLSSGAVKF